MEYTNDIRNSYNEDTDSAEQVPPSLPEIAPPDAAKLTFTCEECAVLNGPDPEPDAEFDDVLDCFDCDPDEPVSPLQALYDRELLNDDWDYEEATARRAARTPNAAASLENLRHRYPPFDHEIEGKPEYVEPFRSWLCMTSEGGPGDKTTVCWSCDGGSEREIVIRECSFLRGHRGPRDVQISGCA